MKIKLNATTNGNIKQLLYILFFTSIIVINIYLISIANYNSLGLVNENNSIHNSIIENFDVEKYVDLCKNRKTNFYDLTPSKLTNALDVSSNSMCELACDDVKCDIFLLKDISNSTMKKCSLFKDPNLNALYDISLTLNCESNILPPNDYGVYNGYGFVNKNYFEDKKSGFQYIDRYLEETELIIDDLSYIGYLNKKANSLDLTNISSKNLYDYIEDQKISVYNTILNSINDVNSRLFNNSKNILFTDLFNHSLSHSEISNNVLIAKTRDMSFIELINNSGTINANSELLKNRQNTLLTNSNSINSIYLILFIIMVLTLILLILYNTNIIGEFVLLSYFVFIIVLILFINNIVKI
jgi:hypothetical protein|uniref:Uncharacterized protein n=1 Tax=viral metagenome TaxID=1070528 RepID=A0A6C0CBC9_9ZZZZ